jgi:integrase
VANTCGSPDNPEDDMLTLYRRHRVSCASRSKGRDYRRCACPIQVEGSLGGETIRRSMDQTSWEAAENIIREWTKAGKIGGGVQKLTLIPDAVKLFFADAESRNLAASSLRIYRRFLGRQLPGWCESKGFRYLKQVTFIELVEFKSTWKMKPATAAKRLELLKQFFGFCVAAGLIETNPAAAFKAPELDEPPTLPYTREEMKRILDACDKYSHHGDHGHNRPSRIKAFVLLLRYSGLRIQDAACLETERLNENDELFLRTQKSGVSVYVPLPPDVAHALRKQAKKNSNPRYFFWSGNGERLSTVSSWQRTLRKLLSDAKVEKRGNLIAHRFRDTLACSLLEDGVPMSDVAAILGNTEAVCEKHYAAWVKERQARLSERLRATWPKQERKLKAVS